MRILLINGSPNLSGSTVKCLQYIYDILKGQGVEVNIFNVPSDIIHCDNCRFCKELKIVCPKDSTIKRVNSLIKESDGIIIGSPVYYYSITSQLQALLTRLFYSDPKVIEHKVCSFFSVSRRTGNTNCFDQVMKIFQMHNAIMVGGTYVNEVYADKPEEIKFDKEGLLSLEAIANNMVTLLSALEGAKFKDFKKVHTNFTSREYLNLIGEKEEREKRIKLLVESYN